MSRFGQWAVNTAKCTAAQQILANQRRARVLKAYLEAAAAVANSTESAHKQELITLKSKVDEFHYQVESTSPCPWAGSDWARQDSRFMRDFNLLKQKAEQASPKNACRNKSSFNRSSCERELKRKQREEERKQREEERRRLQEQQKQQQQLEQPGGITTSTSGNGKATAPGQAKRKCGPCGTPPVGMSCQVPGRGPTNPVCRCGRWVCPGGPSAAKIAQMRAEGKGRHTAYMSQAYAVSTYKGLDGFGLSQQQLLLLAAAGIAGYYLFFK